MRLREINGIFIFVSLYLQLQFLSMNQKKYVIGALAVLALFSCRAPLAVADVKPEKNLSISAELPEDTKFVRTIEPYKNKLEGIMNTKLSHTAVDLTKQGDNSNLGNLLADYTFEGANEWAKNNAIPNMDGAVINIGGIRTTIAAGDILTKQIYEVMPFENEVIIVKLSGADLQGLFDYYLKTKVNNPVSHIVIETDGDRITKQLINGKPVEAAKTYYIATSDYLAMGGDYMDFFKKGEMIPTGIKLRDLFLEKFKANPEVTVSDDVRLQFKNK